MNRVREFISKWVMPNIEELQGPRTLLERGSSSLYPETVNNLHEWGKQLLDNKDGLSPYSIHQPLIQSLAVESPLTKTGKPLVSSIKVETLPWEGGGYKYEDRSAVLHPKGLIDERWARVLSHELGHARDHAGDYSPLMQKVLRKRLSFYDQDQPTQEIFDEINAHISKPIYTDPSGSWGEEFNKTQNRYPTPEEMQELRDREVIAEYHAQMKMRELERLRQQRSESITPWRSDQSTFDDILNASPETPPRDGYFSFLQNLQKQLLANL